MITKISQKLAQQIVNTVKDVSSYNINFIDATGTIFASTDEHRIGDFHEIGYHAAITGETIEVSGNNQFQGTQKGVNIPIFHNTKLMAVIGISGDPDEVRKFAHLAIRITQLLIREHEIDATYFSQKEKMNYIVRTLVKGELSNRTYLTQCLKETKLNETEKMRVVVLQLNTRYNLMNISLLEQKLYQSLQSIQAPLYSYNYPNEYIAILYDNNLSGSLQTLKQLAAEYSQILSIGVGSCHDLYQLKKSYANSYIALKSLNNTENNYAEFDLLDIEVVFGSIDQKTREEYLNKTIATLSENDKILLKTYFEHNMSLTKTCDILFLHKNTLQYKLDRIHRLTGYNPRKFKSAVVLYIAICI